MRLLLAASACVDASGTTDSAKVPEDTGVFVPAPGYQLGAAPVSWIDVGGAIQSRWWDEHDEAVPPPGTWLELSGISHVGDPPGGKFASVTVGAYIACALTPRGFATCWGPSADFQPDLTVSYQMASAGGFHACGLRTDGGVDCWGAEGYPEWFHLDGTGFIEVGASVNDTCALTADRVPVCSTDE